MSWSHPVLEHGRCEREGYNALSVDQRNRRNMIRAKDICGVEEMQINDEERVYVVKTYVPGSSAITDTS
jgi:hypothetical protein